MSDLSIAVVGIGLRLPGARDDAEFWHNILHARDTVSRWRNAFTVAEPKRWVDAYGECPDVERFAPEAFGLTAGQALEMNPQNRLLLTCAREALVGAVDEARAATAVFVGAGANRYSTSLHESERGSGLGSFLLEDRQFSAQWISHTLGLRGPSMGVFTACSSSLVAVHLACQSLLNGECDMALAGGVRLRMPPWAGYQWTPGGVLSPSGVCRPFDSAADGTVPASGCIVVRLRRLDDALKQGDRIRSIIEGTAVGSDGGLGTPSFGAPSVDGQAAVIREALSVSGVDPNDVTFVETHGTGTLIGDSVELAALWDSHQRVVGGSLCRLGSVKANIGHTDAASGLAGVVKTILCLEHGVLPPMANWSQAPTELHLRERGFETSATARAWIAKSRIAGVSSFGMGGTNAHAILAAPRRVSHSRASAVKPDRPPRQRAFWPRRQVGALAAQEMVRAAREGDSEPDEVHSVAEARYRGYAELALRRLGFSGEGPDDEVLERVQPSYRQLVLEWRRTLLTLRAEGGVPSSEAAPRPSHDSTSGDITGPRLHDILTGLVDPRELLLSREQMESDRTSFGSMSSQRKLVRTIHAALAVLPREGSRQVLEIGAGRGLLTEIALEALGGLEAYTVSDISPTFLRLAAERYGRRPDVSCLRFDIDTSPAAQGLENGAFDLILSADVLHLASDPCASLASLRRLLRPGGLLLGWETTGHHWGFEITGRLLSRGPAGSERSPEIFRSLAEFEDLLAQASFSPVAIAQMELQESGLVSFVAGPDPDVETDDEALLWESPSWELSDSPSDPETPERVLALCSEPGECETILELLGDGGQARFLLPEGVAAPEWLSHLALRLSDSDAYRRATEELLADGFVPDAIVHLLGLQLEESVGSRSNDDVLLRHYWSQLFLARALLPAIAVRQGAAALRWLVLTQGQADLDPAPTSDPRKSIASGPVVTLPREYSGVHSRLVDLGGVLDSPAGRNALTRELERRSSGQVVAWRGGRRWERAFVRVPPPSGKQSVPQGVCLVTGGSGGIATELVRHLLKRDGLSFALLARSGAPPVPSSRVRFFNCDITRPDQVHAAIDRARSELGPISMVIHAAGVAGGGLIDSLSEADQLGNLRPKMFGVQNVERELTNDPVDLIVYFSSVTALSGASGMVDYCAANAFMDAMAASGQYGQRPRRLSVNWDRWQGVGLAVAVEEAHLRLTGSPPTGGLELSDALHAFDCALAAGESRLVVSARTAPAVSKARLFRHFRHSNHGRTSPRDPTTVVTRLYAEILGLSEVTGDTDFAEAGGDSLAALHLASSLTDALGVEVYPATVLQYSTVSGLASYLRGESRKEAVPRSTRGRRRREVLTQRGTPMATEDREQD